MKTTAIALLLAAASGGTQASTFTGAAAAPAALWSSGAAAWTPIMEAANRTGSRRVGGSGRSGKGGHYVGGRRK